MVMERMFRASYHAAVVMSLVGLSCGGGGDKAAEHPVASASASLSPPAPKADDPYEVVIAAASCWLGGLWGEAEGEEGAADRRASTARRCMQVVHALVEQDDPVKVESLRVLDQETTDALVTKVRELTHGEGPLEALVSAIVAEAREAAAARRAATRIRADIEKLKTDREKAAARERDADRLSADEAAAAATLRAGSALDALVKLPAGDYAVDAHAIGVLFALTRVRAAQDVPKHMKLYTVAPAFSAVFAAPPPPLPEHAKDRLKPGTWLSYITRVAAACGHPVPDTAKTPREKEALAWSGVLAGFVDRLDADAVHGVVLRDAIRGVIFRLKSPPPAP
jgi:hypothetical protein